jgi:hypothetical protein
METVPKNKRYAIQKLVTIDPSLSIDDLKKLSIVNLLKMIDEQKIKATESIAPQVSCSYESRSLSSYVGCEEDN